MAFLEGSRKFGGRRERLDYYAHEVSLSGSNGADGLRIGEVRFVLWREYWRQRGIFFKGLFGSEKILVRLGFSRNIRVLLLLLLVGCDDWVVAKAGYVA